MHVLPRTPAGKLLAVVVRKSWKKWEKKKSTTETTTMTTEKEMGCRSGSCRQGTSSHSLSRSPSSSYKSNCSCSYSSSRRDLVCRERKHSSRGQSRPDMHSGSVYSTLSWGLHNMLGSSCIASASSSISLVPGSLTSPSRPRRSRPSAGCSSAPAPAAATVTTLTAAGAPSVGAPAAEAGIAGSGGEGTALSAPRSVHPHLNSILCCSPLPPAAAAAATSAVDGATAVAASPVGSSGARGADTARSAALYHVQHQVQREQ